MANILDNLVQQRMQKMQQRDLLKQLFSQQQQQPSINDRMSQGFTEYNPNPTFNVGDLLQSRQPNAIERSIGKTPFKLPGLSKALAPLQQSPYSQAVPAVAQQEQMQQNQSPIVQPENESLVDKKERLLRERNEIKERNAVAKEERVAQRERETEERVAQRNREKEERAEKSKKQLHIDKETLPFYKRIKDMAGTIPEVDARLDEMEELLNTGNVQWFGFLDSLSNTPYIGPFAGAMEQAMSTTESQVFKKLSTDFLRDAKPYFGSNMSTNEVKLFLQRVPSLMLSNEGNRALIRNFRALNEYGREVDKILEGIIAENGGERPANLQSKLQSRTKPAAEKLRKSFRESVKLIPQKDVKNLEKKEDESYGTKKLLKNVSSLALP